MKFFQSIPAIIAVFSFAATVVNAKLVYEYETKYVTVEIVTIVSGGSTYTTERLKTDSITNDSTKTTTTVVIPSSKPTSPESQPSSDSHPTFQSPSPVQIISSTTSINVINNAPSSTKPETTASASPAVIVHTSVFVVKPNPTPTTSSSSPGIVRVVKAAITSSASKPSPQPQENNSGTGDNNNQLSLFSNQILEAHNAKRARHGVNPLTWSNDLYNYANKVANNYDCSGNLRHTNAPYGENLALGYSSAANAVNAWYSEGFTGGLNHFTQVVWKSTTQLGCAYKDCQAKGWGLYVICSYQKPGNIIGQELANVLPLIKS
ncbi:conserved hypothetical protein [Candida dubliniensis CD36]|uniref:SCP domain-containing protein n=1 Tax=Candida dubliniensis (strain CD36 / ATCC MYA-646 / CBS 7987 / NCPF 3949 / NRRL Y-17841) TaxID=573826 RepID=B9W895_CANDC|nr:conserved hypothetical protein [Candida dubliniensis CD36]CAX44950.1 conserved hypothetical protein [Candida dubliniensis CD36]